MKNNVLMIHDHHIRSLLKSFFFVKFRKKKTQHKMDKYEQTIQCIFSLNLNCDLLKRDSDNTSYPELTVRYIDMIIHLLYAFHLTNYAIHLQHQKNILTITKGCETAIFNDPHVQYPFRKHFNGKYGTMSNILTSYYFYLYWHLIEKGVEIDPDEDSKTLFYLLTAVDYQSIPQKELTYINSIIQYMKTKINAKKLHFFNIDGGIGLKNN